MNSDFEDYRDELIDLSRFFTKNPGPRGATEFSVAASLLGASLLMEWRVAGYDRTKFRDQVSRDFSGECVDSRSRCASVTGVPWSTLSLNVVNRLFWVDFDVFPWFDPDKTTDPERILDDLVAFPRAVGLTPAWMKVELAVAGYWSVDEDRLTWDDAYQPSGKPVSREVAEAAFAGQRPVAEVLFGADGPPVGFSRDNPLVIE